MKTLNIAVPALGAYSLPFFEESETILSWIGEREIDRLNRINHLGIAAQAFAGLNHTRLEYVLFQCLLAHLINKTSLDKDNFGINSKIKLSGNIEKISSGEELLKCWAILSNIGHMKNTYADENFVLNQGVNDQAFLSTLLTMIADVELRQFFNKRINQFDQHSTHYLIAAIRISQDAHLSLTRKTELIALLKNLILPLETLFPRNSNDRVKLAKLRRISAIIRLISIVSLDSYNSHHPIRIQTPSLMLNINHLFEDGTAFRALLESTAAWLADELYLHPDVIALRESYQVAAARRFNYMKRHNMLSSKEEIFRRIIQFGLERGLGGIAGKRIKSFARISLPNDSAEMFGNKSIYQIQRKLNLITRDLQGTAIRVDINPYNNVLHLDLLYRRQYGKQSDLAKLCTSLLNWYYTRLKLRARRWRFNMHEILPGDWFGDQFKQVEEDMFSKYHASLNGLFKSILNHIVGPDNSVYFESELEVSRGFRFKAALPSGGEYDDITTRLDELIINNPLNWGVDRMHEVTFLRERFQNASTKLIATSIVPIKVRNAVGRTIDEWDGLIFEVSDNSIKIRILEAKGGASKKRRSEEAYEQLKETQNLIKDQLGIGRTRRKKFPGKGAELLVTLA